MKVNRDQFLEQGFIIVRNVIPAEQLDDLRQSYEILVNRQRAIWAQQRLPSEPPGGHWDISGQPRLAVGNMGDQHDQQTAQTIDFWVHDSIHSINCELLDEPDVPVSDMMLMCSPVQDHGPDDWHRDFSAGHSAPTESYAGDILENGPRYVQWNLPLYDDDVLWVVPGSHVRPNTEAEDQSITRNPRAALPGSVPTQLNAGDGVGYILPILHWASNYSTKMRRTVHGGYTRTAHYNDMPWLEYLSPSAQDTFNRWDKRNHTYIDLAVGALRAVVEKDAAAYLANLDQLWPGRGPKGLLHSTICLSKTAKYIFNQRCREADQLTVADQDMIASIHPMTMQWGRPLAERFTPREATIIRDRFKPLDDALQAEVELTAPGFRGKSTRYFPHKLPDGLTVNSWIASWDRSES